MGSSDIHAGGNPAMDQHANQGGGVILLLASIFMLEKLNLALLCEPLSIVTFLLSFTAFPINYAKLQCN